MTYLIDTINPRAGIRLGAVSLPSQSMNPLIAVTDAGKVAADMSKNRSAMITAGAPGSVADALASNPKAALALIKWLQTNPKFPANFPTGLSSKDALLALGVPNSVAVALASNSKASLALITSIKNKLAGDAKFTLPSLPPLPMQPPASPGLPAPSGSSSNMLIIGGGAAALLLLFVMKRSA